MDFAEMTERALVIRALYEDYERRMYGRQSGDRLAQLKADGKVRAPLRPPGPLPEPGHATGPMTASEALEDDRGT